MKRSEILNLIEEKEEHDKMLKRKGELRAKFTEEIFHKIKQQIMDDLVKLSVNQGYKLRGNDVDCCILNNILKLDDFSVHANNCNIDVRYGCCYLIEDYSKDASIVAETREFLMSFDRCFIKENVNILLKKHGFTIGFKRGHQTLTTTKENLLKYPEIIYNGVATTLHSPTSPTAPSHKESPSITLWQVFVIILVILGGLLFKVFS